MNKDIVRDKAELLKINY